MSRRTIVPTLLPARASAGVVDVLTGVAPIVPPIAAGPLSTDDARALTERIRATAREVRDRLERLRELVEQARAGEAWSALGYASWTAYLSETLAAEPMRLDARERREVVQYLTGQGMSTRAIAPAVGVKQPQVVKDLAAARQVIPQESPDGTVALVTGLDGKAYAAARPHLALVPAAPAVEAAPASPIEAARQDLRGALAGLDLDEHEQRLAAWLEGWDVPTLLALTSIIGKARASRAPAREA